MHCGHLAHLTRWEEYVLAKHPEKWARAFFNGRRFGHLTSNVAESGNAFISDLRTLSKTYLFAGFIRKVNALFIRRRSLHATLRPRRAPKQTRGACREGGRLVSDASCRPTLETLFEVQRMASRNEFLSVDIGALKGGYGFSQEEAMPARLRGVPLQSRRPEDPCHPRSPRRCAAGAVCRVHYPG